MSRNKVGIIVGSAIAAAGLVVGGATLSNAASGTSSGTSSSSSSGSAGPVHSAVTGSDLSKVTAAVKAKDSSVTVTSVQKDGDGSYDVSGTKAGAEVRYEVSADLKTITVGGGHGGRGGADGTHTTVTGSAAASVTAAVKAKDSGVTVSSVVKEGDGSYDVWGTKSGAQVKYEVSSDLKTITLDTHTGGPASGGPAA